MANINYRIKEINQRVSKDYAIQFDIGKQLKENLKIYDIHKSKSKDFFSNYEEEETKNEKYYQEFLSQLFTDSERKKKPSKIKNSKTSNSPLCNNKKIFSPNSFKNQSPLRINSKKSSGKKSIGNMSPSNKSDKQGWLKRYYRNSCMIPIVENKLNQDNNEANLVEGVKKENNNNFVIQRIQNINQEEKKISSNCIKTITFCKTTSNVNKENNNKDNTNKVKQNHIVLCCIPFKCL